MCACVCGQVCVCVGVDVVCLYPTISSKLTKNKDCLFEKRETNPYFDYGQSWKAAVLLIGHWSSALSLSLLSIHPFFPFVSLLCFSFCLLPSVCLSVLLSLCVSLYFCLCALSLCFSLSLCAILSTCRPDHTFVCLKSSKLISFVTVDRQLHSIKKWEIQWITLLD